MKTNLVSFKRIEYALVKQKYALEGRLFEKSDVQFFFVLLMCQNKFQSYSANFIVNEKKNMQSHITSVLWLFDFIEIRSSGLPITDKNVLFLLYFQRDIYSCYLETT